LQFNIQVLTSNVPGFPRETDDFLHQKSEYVENNPVRKRYVLYPEDWCWSSASKAQRKIIVTSVED
jgi:hypothetical protein